MLMAGRMGKGGGKPHRCQRSRSQVRVPTTFLPSKNGADLFSRSDAQPVALQLEKPHLILPGEEFVARHVDFGGREFVSVDVEFAGVDKQ